MCFSLFDVACDVEVLMESVKTILCPLSI